MVPHCQADNYNFFFLFLLFPVRNYAWQSNFETSVDQTEIWLFSDLNERTKEEKKITEHNWEHNCTSNQTPICGSKTTLTKWIYLFYHQTQDKHSSSSLRRIHRTNICACHSFNSVFGNLHKVAHYFVELLQPWQRENDGGPIRTGNLQFS